MATLEAEGRDVGADRLRNAQPVQGKQRHEGVITRRGEPGGNEDGAKLVRSRWATWDSWSMRGRRMWTAGEWSMTPSSSA
jgi:hypothetical protein